MLFIGIADVPYIPISEDRDFTALLISATPREEMTLELTNMFQATII